LSDATAVLLATASAADGGPAALLPLPEGTVIARLAAQLSALGVAELEVVTRPEHAAAVTAAVGAGSARVQVSPTPAEDLRIVARLASQRGDRPLVVVPADVVAHGEALRRVIADPRLGTGVLVAAGDGAHAVRAYRGRVVSAASEHHEVARPNGEFAGLLKVGAAELPLVAGLGEPLAGLAGGDDGAALLLVGLVRSGAHVTAAPLRGLYWARPGSAAAAARAAEELAAADEDRALLDSAVKDTDGFFTTFFVSPYSRHLARWAARRGLTPNQVTTFSLLLGLLAAAAFATGERSGLIAGAVLLQLAFTADCVDGQLARYTRTFSAFGGWLDAMFDRAKEYLVFAGLAIGASRTGDPVWLLACCALALQTVRHMIDFAYGAVEHRAAVSVRQPPLHQASDGARPAGAPTRSQGLLGSWQALNRTPAVLWLKKMVAFPIGERFAVISLTAALFSARATFVALLAWGGVATAYSLTGRVLRSIAR
jgi:phosphatidylglycerophosphate synthase